MRGSGCPVRAIRHARAMSPSSRQAPRPLASQMRWRSPRPPTKCPPPTRPATWCCNSRAGPRRSGAPCWKRVPSAGRWSAGTMAASPRCCRTGCPKARSSPSTWRRCRPLHCSCWRIRRGHRIRCPIPCDRCRTRPWGYMQNSMQHAAADANQYPGWRWAPAWVVAYVALWPAPGYAEGLLVLGARGSLWRVLVSRCRGGARLLSHQAWALTSVLFMAYWLPELVSGFDAVDPGRAMREAAVDLRYLPFLWLAASAVANARGRRITFGGLAIIVAIWTIDGVMQALGSASPLFSAMDGIKQAFSGRSLCTPEEMAAVDRLGGVFGPCNLKLGPVLASRSPFALYALGRRFGSAGWGIAAALIGLVIVLAGSRAAWLAYALVLLFSGWRLLGWKRLLGVFALGVLTLVALGMVSTPVRGRIERTTQVVSADRNGLEVALSGRTRIWQA